MKRYSDSDVDRLIEELTEAAEEAILKAAAEAAKAAMLAGVEREAEAIRNAKRWKQEAERLQRERTKNCMIAGILGLFGGFAFGTVMQTTNNK